MSRRSQISDAVVVHAIINLLISIYVLITQQWSYWWVLQFGIIDNHLDIRWAKEGYKIPRCSASCCANVHIAKRAVTSKPISCSFEQISPISSPAISGCTSPLLHSILCEKWLNRYHLRCFLNTAEFQLNQSSRHGVRLDALYVTHNSIGLGPPTLDHDLGKACTRYQ